MNELGYSKMKQVGYRMVISLAVSVTLAAASEARGASSRDKEKVSFDITAPSMMQALIEFTQQSGLQLMIPTSTAADIPAPRIIGSYTPTAALEQLLAGTPLRYEFANSRTVAIRTAGAREGSVPSTSKGEGGGSEERITVANAAEGAARPSSTESADPPVASKAAIPEILVKGSRTLNMDIQRTVDDAQPYVVFDRLTIERSSAVTTEDFLKNRLTMNSNPVASGSTSRINLRGLGSSQTLILIDGHRVAGFSTGSGFEQPDINSIPLAAIERIEVLPTTASGIYGGGATGGAINIVLRRDYSGLDAKVGYGSTLDGGGANRRVDLSFGSTLEGGKTSVTVNGSYFDANLLFVGDRDFAVEGRQWVRDHNRSAIFGSSLNPPLGATVTLIGGTRSAINPLPFRS